MTDVCTDLDVQQLIEAGRAWDAVTAGRMLPRLARLHGYGFEVDVAKVRAANLGVEAANLGDGFLFGVDLFGGSPRFGGASPPPPPSFLFGTAQKALDSCISGEGEPPLELLIAAVACAGSGVICGIPVEQMREDAMTELDLCKKGLREAAVMLVAYLIPAMAALTSLDLRSNDIGTEGAKVIADALSSGRAGLTSLNLEDNNIGAEGAKTIANALQSGKAVLSSLNLADNALCGKDAYGQGTYDASGIRALASALAGNAVLTALDLSNNKLTNGRYVKQSKLSGHNYKVGDMAKHEGLELQVLYKDKDSGGDVLLGTLAAFEAIAEALKINTVLTICNLLKNDLDIKSAMMLAEIGKEKRIMLSGIKHDQTEAKFGGYTLQPADGILIASDLRVSLVLSSLSLHLNGISNEGAKAIAEALSSGRAVQTNLNLAGNLLGTSSGIGPEGARAIAEALRFKALLKELECASAAHRTRTARRRTPSPRSPFLRLHTRLYTLAFLATSRHPLTHTRVSTHATQTLSAA